MKSRQNRRRGRVPRQLQVGHIPPVAITSIIRRTFRFVATGATVMAFTVNDLMDLYFVATAANAGYRLAGAVKLEKFECWAPPFASGGAARIASVAFQWATVASSIIGAPSKVITDTTAAASDCAHIVTRPPKGSLAANWLSPSATTTEYVATFNCPIDTICDLTLSLHLPEGGVGNDSPNPVVRAVAGASAGTQYVSSLPTSGILLVPLFTATL